MPEKWGCVWARMPCPKQMAPFLCRLVVPVAGLTAAELPYSCPPAAAALQLLLRSSCTVCPMHTFLCITLATLCCLASIHTQGQPLTHPLSCTISGVCPFPGPATSQRAQHCIHSSATSTQVLLSP